MRPGPVDRFVANWRSCSFRSPPYFFPGDEFLSATPSVTVLRGFADYIAGPTLAASADRTLHVGLLPTPYFGHLQNSTVFILMLNPGLTAAHYFAESHVEEYRCELGRSLRQENGRDDYPFTHLNPRFAWHPGFRYWEAKLREVVKRAMVADRDMTYQAALSRVAKSVAVLQLVPYRSPSFRLPRAVLNRLASVRLVKGFVHEVLVPRAQRDDVLIIVVRGARIWRLPKHRNIIKYEGSESRAGHLTGKTVEAIAKRLGV